MINKLDDDGEHMKSAKIIFGWVKSYEGVYVTEATKVEQFQEETENDIKCSRDPVR